MTAERQKFGLVGAGLMGQQHLKAARASSLITITDVFDPNPSVCDQLAEQGYSVHGALEDLLSAPDLAGIILATPTNLHVAQARSVVGAGLPVLIEKPIAANLEEAQGLLELAEQTGVPILVGHHRRHNPIVAKAKEIIQSGTLGPLTCVTATCWLAKPNEYFDDAPWRKQLGAGPISVNMAHDIDLLRYLCGEIVAVQAVAKPSTRGFENEEAAAALLTFESGCIGTISVSDSTSAPWSWELTAGENPAYPKTDQSCYMIGGQYGSLSVPDLRLWKSDRRPHWWAPMGSTYFPVEDVPPLVSQLEHFGQVIDGKVEPKVSVASATASVRVLEAIQMSVRQGRAIDLGEPAPSAATAQSSSNLISMKFRN